ncbi:hypothetical protein JCM8547_004312 [Rhodosporidiobolus lusitaniae]
MDHELSAASAFLASYLPRPVDEQFSKHLETALAQRYSDHWHSADPERGSAFRALVRTPCSLDHSILVAAAEAGISRAQLEQALAGRGEQVTLGERWTLWVDPGCVSLRVDRGDETSSARDGQFIEIYGKLPESLAGFAVSLAAVAASSNISPPLEAGELPASSAAPSSPVKRSKAIQIVAPPGGRSALQAMTNAALHPDSPAAAGPVKPTALLASPLIIPPTPVRPLPATEADVFSPTPAVASSSSSSTSTLLLPRSPSPNAGGKYGSLSPSTYRPSSPLGMPMFTRRSSSRTSSVSSTGTTDDGETSGTDSLFSASGDSIASLTSAASSVPHSALWKGADHRSRDLVDADGFRVPALPLARPQSAASGGNGGPFYPSHAYSHSCGSSISSLAPPPSPSRPNGGLSPTSPSSLYGGRSLPGSPTKPRRRGVRGGQGHRSDSAQSSHSHSSSISSLASLTSTATPSTPSQPPSSSAAAIERSTTPSGAPSTSRSRTRTDTSTSATNRETVATEYSNGLVKVLGGGVLLGCGGGSSAPSGGKTPREGGSRSVTPSGADGQEGGRRRRRERGRGGRSASGQGGQQQQQQPGAGGERSPMGSFSAPSPFAQPGVGAGGYPTSPVWLQASPFHHPQHHYGGYGAAHQVPHHRPTTPLQG